MCFIPSHLRIGDNRAIIDAIAEFFFTSSTKQNDKRAMLSYQNFTLSHSSNHSRRNRKQQCDTKQHAYTHNICGGKKKKCPNSFLIAILLNLNSIPKMNNNIYLTLRNSKITEKHLRNDNSIHIKISQLFRFYQFDKRTEN